MNNPSFSFNLAMSQIANMCQLSYRKEVVTSDDGLTSALLVVYTAIETGKKTYLVAFRGTDTWDDWVLTNFIFLQKSINTSRLKEQLKERHKVRPVDQMACPNIEEANLFSFPVNIQVHFGFWRAYVSVREEIQTKFDEEVEVSDDIEVIFTGHSLGGAIACLAAIDYKLLNPNANVKLATFGAPRAGNRVFAEFVENQLSKSNIARITTWGDFVPLTPSWGYTHINGDFNQMNFPDQWWKIFNPIACHDIETYVNILSGI